MDDPLTFTYPLLIRATPQQVWTGLTDPSMTTQWQRGLAARSDWRPGSDFVMEAPDGRVARQGKVLTADAPRRLVQTLLFTEFGDRQEVTRAVDIEPYGQACQVTVTLHAGPADAPSFESVARHCHELMSGLKTLLETGTGLNEAMACALPSVAARS